jgi:hypothetical protein
LLQGFRQIKIKQQEATIASLKAELKGIIFYSHNPLKKRNKLFFKIFFTKAMQSDLDIMTENVAKLFVALAGI